jgi:hypothetical protein
LEVGIVTGLTNSLPGCRKNSWNVVKDGEVEEFEVEGNYKIRERQDREFPEN